MINKHLTTVAAMAMMASAGLPVGFSLEGHGATEEQRQRKLADRLACAEEAIAKAKEKAKRKKKRNKLLVKLRGLN